MKILHTGDWHLGKKLETFNRIEEQREVLSEICKVADDEKIDVVLIAGDVYDTYNPPTEAIELFYRTVHRLSKNGKRLVFVIAGNHDSADRIEAPEPLAEQNGIFLAGYPDTFIDPIVLDSGLQLVKSDHGLAEFKLPEGEILRLIFTPFANEVRLKRAFESDNREISFGEMLVEKWQNLASKYCNDEGFNILVSHLFFISIGYETIESGEEEKPIVYVGGTQSIDISEIPKQIDYVALGHLHRFQHVGAKESKAVYSGSPLSYSFAEAGQEKYVVIIENEKNTKKYEIKKVKLTTGKQLLRKKFDNVDEAIDWVENHQNNLLELTIRTNDFMSAADRKRLHDAHSGIVYIYPELLNEQKMMAYSQQFEMSDDMIQLFRKYFISRKQQEPDDTIISLFKEIIGNVD